MDDTETADLTARLAALEARLVEAEKRTNFFRVGQSDDGVPYLMTEGRLGVMTDFWAKKPRGEGAALSVGTGVDWCAGYFEIDEVSNFDRPSVGIYASVVCPNPKQYNIAIDLHAANSAKGNGAIMADSEVVLAKCRIDGQIVLVLLR